MPAAAVRLLVDGDPVEIRYAMGGMVAVERRFGASAWTEHPLEAGAYAAWFTLGMPGGPDAFDDWCTKVEMDTDQPVDPPTAVAASSSELLPPSP